MKTTSKLWFGITVGMIMSAASWATENDPSKLVQQLNTQLQSQLQQIQEKNAKDNKAFNTQVQTQLKQMQDDLQAQMQKLNLQIQEQMKQLQTGLNNELQQVHKEVSDLAAKK